MWKRRQARSSIKAGSTVSQGTVILRQPNWRILIIYLKSSTVSAKSRLIISDYEPQFADRLICIASVPMASESDASSHRTIPSCFELCSILVSSWRVSGSRMFPQRQTCWLPTVSSPADVLLSTLLNDKPAFKAMISENRRRLTAASTFCREWFRKRGVHAFNTVAYFSCLS